MSDWELIRYLTRVVDKQFPSPAATERCPWCFAPMSEHRGGVECDNGADTEAPEATGKHATVRKAPGVYPPPRPWYPYPEYPEGD